jgi:hypothetical protein
VHQAVNLLLRLVTEGSGLDAWGPVVHPVTSTTLTVHELGADLVSIAELLEEAGMLADTLDAKGLVLAADGVNKVVVGDGDGALLALNLGDVWRQVSTSSELLGAPYPRR